MEYLNSRDVAEILGVNVSTIKRWTDEGKLTCDKTAGGHRKFHLHHIAHFLEIHDSHKNQLNSLILDKELGPEIGMEIISGEFAQTLYLECLLRYPPMSGKDTEKIHESHAERIL